MLSQASEQKIEQLLVSSGHVDKAKLGDLKIESAKSNKTLIQLLVDRKVISSLEATKLIAQASGLRFVDLGGKTTPEDVINLIPREVAEAYKAVPFASDGGLLSVAMVDPENLQAVDFIARKTGYQIKPYLADPEQIQAWINRISGNLKVEVSEALESGEEPKSAELVKQKDAKQVETIVQDAPITRALNTILEYAAQSRASDIHIEPRENEVKIRYRIDGILREVMSLPKSTEAALVTRIKILSNLKIDEHRVPQDGQAKFVFNGKEIDLRINIAPITFGEQVVIRLLDKTDSLIKLNGLGFRGQAAALVQKGINKPHGMVLSTGPTGSGKSTTLYAIIQEIITPKINIVTLEDPVEYSVNGVNQMQVNPGVGLTFANGLRSILRQDPNVIMVGEIRDHETADLAVQSSLTGHLVLSTLHTNSAAGVLPRLLDMGIEPYLIASTVNTVIGQRLVRKVCTNCRKPYQAIAAAVEMINKVLGDVLPKSKQEVATKVKYLGYDNLPLAGQTAYTLYKGEGCDQCQDGYQGRIGIFEVFEINAAIEKLLLGRATSTAIQQQACVDGMLTMQQDGLLKTLTGITTLEEVARVASDY
jgi:type IV pilus assembly protein PilB